MAVWLFISLVVKLWGGGVYWNDSVHLCLSFCPCVSTLSRTSSEPLGHLQPNVMWWCITVSWGVWFFFCFSFFPLPCSFFFLLPCSFFFFTLSWLGLKKMPSSSPSHSYWPCLLQDAPGGGVTAGLTTARTVCRIIVRDLSGKFCWENSVLYSPPWCTKESSRQSQLAHSFPFLYLLSAPHPHPSPQQ